MLAVTEPNSTVWIPNVSIWAWAPPSDHRKVMLKEREGRKEGNSNEVAGCHPVIKPLNSTGLTRSLGRCKQIQLRIPGRMFQTVMTEAEIHLFDATRKLNLGGGCTFSMNM